MHAFSTCELRSRNEVSVAGYENDHVRLAFQRDRRNVEPDAHIDALLSQRRTEGVVSQIVDGQDAVQKKLLWLEFQNPGSVSIFAHMTQSYGEVGRSVQLFKEPDTEDCSRRCGVVDWRPGDRRVTLLDIRPTVIEKNCDTIADRSSLLYGLGSVDSGALESVVRPTGRQLWGRSHRCPSVQPEGALGNSRRQSGSPLFVINLSRRQKKAPGDRRRS